MSIDVRPIQEIEVSAFRLALARGFGSDLEEEANDRFKTLIPLERTVAAFDGDEVVGTLGDYAFEMTVPGGGAVPLAGTTMVTVRQTHRRRGILTSMIRRHFQVAAERGDAIAGLWASEAPIYGRFGYGAAVDRHAIQFTSGHVLLPPPPTDIQVRYAETEQAATLLPAVYDRAVKQRPGMLTRSEPWWTNRRLYDPESARGGRSALRHVVAWRGEDPIGYAAYRQKERWDDWVPQGEVAIIEIQAVDDDARRALWHYLSTIDLFPGVEWWNAPVDDPLVVEVNNRRLVNRRITDTLWLRVLDVAKALEGRGYEVDGHLRLGVADAVVTDNEGVYELTVESGVGVCRRVDDEPDVVMTVEHLGALYLGGRSAPQLAAAGRITGAPEAVIRLDTLMRTAIAPWCPEVF